MKSFVFTLLTVLLLFSFQGCLFCEEGNGIAASENRKVSGFRSISVTMPAAVTIRHAAGYSVQIKADENLMDRISSRVRGKKLILETRGCIRPEREVRVLITLPAVEEITLSSAGSVYMPDTLHVKKLLLKVNGSGDMDLKLTAASLNSTINGSGDIVLAGSANRHEIRINGSGKIDARDLPSNTTSVKVNGSGDVQIYSIQDLNVHINGSGNVYYRGKPSLHTRINGTGKVVDQN